MIKINVVGAERVVVFAPKQLLQWKRMNLDLYILI